MKKIVSGIIAIVITFSSIAQTNDSASSQHKKHHLEKKHLKGSEKFEKLNLTNEQKAEIKTINESFGQQMQDVKNDKSLSVEEQKTRRKSLIKEHKEKLHSMLTPEQRKQAQGAGEEFTHRKHDKKNEKRFDKTTKGLNLNSDQSAKIADLNATLKSNLKNIQQNTALSKEEKKEQMRLLMSKHKAEVKALLTEDQKRELKDSRKNRHSNNAVK